MRQGGSVSYTHLFIEQVRQGTSEVVRSHVVGVASEGRVTKRHVRGVWAGSAETPEVLLPSIAEAGGGQPRLELDTGELRVPAAARGAAHVDDELDACSSEQLGKLVAAHGLSLIHI